MFVCALQLPPDMEPGLIHVEVQKGAFLGEAQPVLVMREGPAREQVPFWRSHLLHIPRVQAS